LYNWLTGFSFEKKKKELYLNYECFLKMQIITKHNFFGITDTLFLLLIV